MAAQHGKILQPKGGGLTDGDCGRWRRGFETDGEENHLFVRMLLRQRHRVAAFASTCA